MSFLTVTMIVLSVSLLFWQRSQRRQKLIRWSFYALRDELRWKAANDASLAADPLFVEFDWVLTCGGRDKGSIGIFQILAVVVAPSSRAKANQHIAIRGDRIAASAHCRLFTELNSSMNRLVIQLIFAKTPVLTVVTAIAVIVATAGRITLDRVAEVFTGRGGPPRNTSALPA